SKHQPRQVRHIHRRSPLACQKVREQMESALTETPPPSLDEVMARLGYRDRTTLRTKFPELSKKITSNYRASERFISSQQSRHQMPLNVPDVESQRKALESELDKPCPATIKDLGRRFGYNYRTNIINTRFPDLARTLIEKRRQYQQQQLTKRIN